MKYFATVICSLLLVGCTPPVYVLKDSSTPVAFLKFERNVEAPVLGSGTYFFTTTSDFECRGAIENGIALARMDEGNPLVSNLNENGLMVEAQNDFKVVVRNIAGLAGLCESAFTMDIKPDEEYTITIDAMLYAPPKCSVSVTNKNQQTVELRDYLDCSRRD